VQAYITAIEEKTWRTPRRSRHLSTAIGRRCFYHCTPPARSRGKFASARFPIAIFHFAIAIAYLLSAVVYFFATTNPDQAIALPSSAKCQSPPSRCQLDTYLPRAFCCELLFEVKRATITAMIADFTKNSDAGEEPALNEYQQLRARNIERNNARLRSLGLISLAEEKSSNDEAWGRGKLSSQNDDIDDEEDSSSDSDEEYCEGKKSSKKKRKKKRSQSALPPREGSRKSRRLLHLPSECAPEGFTGDDLEIYNGTAEERKERIQKERVAMVEECREARQRAAVEVAKAGIKMAGKENPTATYEHCLMRVRSMTEKGLANRVSVGRIAVSFIEYE